MNKKIDFSKQIFNLIFVKSAKNASDFSKYIQKKHYTEFADSLENPSFFSFDVKGDIPLPILISSKYSFLDSEKTISDLLDFKSIFRRDCLDQILSLANGDELIPFHKFPFENQITNNVVILIALEPNKTIFSKSDLSIKDWASIYDSSRVIANKKLIKIENLIEKQIQNVSFIVKNFSVLNFKENIYEIHESLRKFSENDNFDAKFVFFNKKEKKIVNEFYYSKGYLSKTKQESNENILIAKKTYEDFCITNVEEVLKSITKYKLKDSLVLSLFQKLGQFNLNQISLFSKVSELSDSESMFLKLFLLFDANLSDVLILIDDPFLVLSKKESISFLKLCENYFFEKCSLICTSSKYINLKSESSKFRVVNITKENKEDFENKKLIKLKNNIVIDRSSKRISSYLKIENEIAKIFASSFEAQKAGYLEKDFSFSKNSRVCQFCLGSGKMLVENQSFQIYFCDFFDTCNHCSGIGFNEKLQSLVCRSKTIADIYSNLISENYDFSSLNLKLRKTIEVLITLGLGHLSFIDKPSSLNVFEQRRLFIASKILQKAESKDLFEHNLLNDLSIEEKEKVKTYFCSLFS